jgi:hypothetical protein
VLPEAIRDVVSLFLLEEISDPLVLVKLGLRGESSSFGDSQRNHMRKKNKKGIGGDLNGGE